MARYEVEDDGIPGLTLALRVRLKGHDVALAPGTTRRELAETFTLPAPYRDLFLKSGAPLEESTTLVAAPGHASLLSGIAVELPSVGPQAPALAAALGEAAGAQWAAFMRNAADIWGLLRADEYHSTASLHRRVRGTLRDRRLRILLDDYIAQFGLDPDRVGDAAMVLPYLDQTFGRWRFAEGLPGLERALRARCAELGVGFEANEGEPLSLRSFWSTQFAAPARIWRAGAMAPVATHELGLPWIGMAAEFIADRIGRVAAPGR